MVFAAFADAQTMILAIIHRPDIVGGLMIHIPYAAIVLIRLLIVTQRQSIA